jgi:hypothetical protein
VLADTSMLEVSNILAWTLDPDAIKAHELRFEEISHGKTIDKLFREFRDLIRGINQTTFRKLQKEYAHNLPKLQELIQVARKNQLI